MDDELQLSSIVYGLSSKHGAIAGLAVLIVLLLTPPSALARAVRPVLQ